MSKSLRMLFFEVSGRRSLCEWETGRTGGREKASKVKSTQWQDTHPVHMRLQSGDPHIKVKSISDKTEQFSVLARENGAQVTQQVHELSNS